MSQHWDQLEADFCRYYQLDLRQALWGPGRVGIRRLRSLISQLPPDSAVRRKVDGGYSWEREMSAQTVDLLNVVAAGHRLKGKPVQVPRPWARKKARRRMADVMRGFGR